MIICIDLGIDLSDGKGRFLQLKHTEKIFINILYTQHPMGFLPNDDIIIVSLNNELKEYKIYSYSFKSKPATNTTPWKCSQIYDIEIPESSISFLNYYKVYQTKLFFFYGYRFMTQMDLLTMSFDTQYFFDEEYRCFPIKMVLNKDQTLLTFNFNSYLIIFSMKTGTRISSYGYG